MRAAAAGSIAIALSIAGCHPNRGGETVPCAAGEPIWIGCNAACGLGSCWGDPALRVCEGDVDVATCNDDRALVVADDSEGICPSSCPVARTVCPPSGRITVTVQRGRGDYTCDWAVAQRALLDGDVIVDAAGSVDAEAADAALDASVDDAEIVDAEIEDAEIEDAEIVDAEIVDAGMVDAPSDARGGRDR